MAPLWTDKQNWWFNVWTYVILGLLMAFTIAMGIGAIAIAARVFG